MNTPTRVIIEPDTDIIVKWSTENEHAIHDAVLVSVQEMLTNTTKDEIIMIEFFESELDTIAFADVSMHREDILEGLQLAEAFYVDAEDYEKALDVKNLLTIANIKLTEQ